MKRSLFILVVVAVAALSILGAMLVTASPTPAAASLTPQEASDLPQWASDLRYAREEEKLARDVYRHLDTLWGDEIGTFANIAPSEDRHTLAIKVLLDRYLVPDPAASTADGEFENEDLQLAYDVLVADGSASLAAALQVGVDIEEMDIEHLESFRENTDQRDITKVYTNLIEGSHSHLEAFLKVLAR